MATFSFKCLECKNSFSVDKEGVEHTNELKNVFCPSCGKKWGSPDAKIELQVAVAGGAITHSRTRIADDNREASRYAEHEAMKDREYLDRENPQVAPGVRKSAVDTINARAKELL